MDAPYNIESFFLHVFEGDYAAHEMRMSGEERDFLINRRPWLSATPISEPDMDEKAWFRVQFDLGGVL